MGRLNTPNDQVGADYVLGCKNARYYVPTLSHVDRELANLTGRIRRWIESGKFEDLVETLTTDRDMLLERRIYLMLMGEQGS